MRKANVITREIMFVSKKDGQKKIVNNDPEFKFAKQLEEDESVSCYCSSVQLENWFERISLSGIRKAYRETDWLSSFLVEYTDGSKAVFEIVRSYALKKRANIEKLEISRRYWTAVGVDKWQVVVVKGAEYGLRTVSY